MSVKYFHQQVLMASLQALCQAAQSSKPEAQQISRCVTGILFFGVPNEGLNHESLREAVKNQRNKVLLRELTEGSGYLTTLKTNFQKLLEEKDYRIVSFYETQDTAIAVLNEKVLVPNFTIVQAISHAYV